MDMQVKQIRFADLDNYQKIPMLKKFSSLIDFDEHLTIKETKTSEQVIDLAKEESIEEWVELLPEDTTAIYVITKGKQWIAGTIIVTHAPNVHMLQNDMNNAVLWDIRVHPNYQGHGLGKKLFNFACSYGQKQGCNHLLIETQNNNPNAIKFYQRMGAFLYKVNKEAYKDQPEEIQYIFKKPLT